MGAIMDRRSFVGVFGLIGLVSAVSSPGSIGITEIFSRRMGKSWDSAVSAWFEQSLISPHEYLMELGVLDAGGPGEIKAMISSEFRAGEVLSVDGFILSKLEVALLIEALQISSYSSLS